LLEQIDKHDHVEMILGTEYVDITPFLHAGFEVKVQPTLLLNCKPPLAELWAGLRDKTRNAIRRAREQLTVQCIEDVSQFTRFYEENLEDDIPYFSLAASAAATAAACDRKQGKIVAATDADGVDHAMVVFLWDDHQVYYLHSSRKKNLAHAGAVSLLLWTGIELAHSRGLWFDFDAGLSKLSRYKFLISFGGRLRTVMKLRAPLASIGCNTVFEGFGERWHAGCQSLVTFRRKNVGASKAWVTARVPMCQVFQTAI